MDFHTKDGIVTREPTAAEKSKMPEEKAKNDYNSLTTDKDKLDFMAAYLGLKNG